MVAAEGVLVDDEGDGDDDDDGDVDEHGCGS